MKLMDFTKSISFYLGEKCENIQRGGVCGIGDWCRSMRIIDGVETYKTFFRKRERTIPKIAAEFEIWNESTVAIPKDIWNTLLPKIESHIKQFEIETGQSIIVKKVDGPTQWSDY